MIRVYSQDEELLAVFANDGSNKCPYFDDELYEELNGISELTFSVPMNHPDAQHVVEENLVVIEDPDEPGVYRLFTIKRLEEVRDEDGKLYKRAECEEQAISELNDEIITDRRPQNTTARDALIAALESEGGSRWQVGTVDATGNASTNFYYESRMSALQKILETWQMEVRFRVELTGTRITGRYVDLFNQRGEDNGIRVEIGRNLKSIKRTVETDHIKTALYGRGKGEQVEETGGYGRRITFADVEWSTTAQEPPDPTDKPAGQEWVGDPEALERWGYPNPDGTKRHRFGVYVNEEQEDPKALLQETWEELQRLKNPRVTYEATMADLGRLAGYPHYRAKMGDVVRVIDKGFNPPLAVEARVIKRRRPISDDRESELTLGNFRPEITDLIRNIQQDVERKVEIGAPISWLETVMQTKAREMDNLPGYMAYTPGQGLLVANAPDLKDATSAIEIRGGGFRISNKPIKKPDGTVDFEWRTFGGGDGFTADEITAGTLNASLVQIRSQITDSEGEKEITLYDGYFTSYFDGQKTVEVGGYAVWLWPYRPDGSIPDEVAGIIGGTVYTSSGGVIADGIGIAGTDHVTLGRYNSETHSIAGEVFYSNFVTKRGGVYGPPSSNTDDFVVFEIGSDARYREEGRLDPMISLVRGRIDGSYLANVNIYVGDSESDENPGWFSVYKNPDDGSDFLITVGSEYYYFNLEKNNRQVLYLSPHSSISVGGGWTRFKATELDYITQSRSTGEIHFYMGGSVRHRFRPDGTKSGGSIEIDGMVWGMSPIDSPRVILSDLITGVEVTEDGTTIKLDDRLAKAMSSYTVFANRPVEITEQTPNSFKVSGPQGKVDLLILGIRAGYENEYFTNLSGITDSENKAVKMQSLQGLQMQSPQGGHKKRATGKTMLAPEVKRSAKNGGKQEARGSSDLGDTPEAVGHYQEQPARSGDQSADLSRDR